MRAEYDFSQAAPGRRSAEFAGRPWWVLLDADLVSLLTMEGDLATRLKQLSRTAPTRSRRTEAVVALTDDEHEALRSLLTRIKAKVKYVPAAAGQSRSARRRAG